MDASSIMHALENWRIFTQIVKVFIKLCNTELVSWWTGNGDGPLAKDYMFWIRRNFNLNHVIHLKPFFLLFLHKLMWNTFHRFFCELTLHWKVARAFRHVNPFKMWFMENILDFLTRAKFIIEKIGTKRIFGNACENWNHPWPAQK